MREFGWRLFHTPAAGLALLLLIGVMGISIAAPQIAPYDPTDIKLIQRLKPPLWVGEEGGVPHYLGTDSLGRDVLSRIIYGSRVSMSVGFTVVAISGTIGVTLGLVSGFFNGSLLDDVLMRLADIQLSFPFFLIAVAILAVLGPGLKNLIIVLAMWGWISYARVVRGQAIALRKQEFVEASRAIGAGPLHIMLRHILPNTWATTIVIASFAVASTIVAEAGLSFLGLGVPPSVPTWGGMLSEGRDHIALSWWIVLFPGLAIMATVLCINIFGDWLRDYLDPRLRQR